MSYRTTRQADRDIADIYVQGEAVFGTAQAERYQDGLFDAFDILADNPRRLREPVRESSQTNHSLTPAARSRTWRSRRARR